MNSKELYEDMVDEIIVSLDKGDMEWISQWSSGLPTSMASGKAYSGTNIFALSLHKYRNGFSSNFYATYGQIQKLGGRVKKGSVSSPIWYYQPMVKTDKNGEEVNFAMLKHYYVFNLEQTTLEDTQEPKEVIPIDEAEALIKNYKFTLESGVPSYSPTSDIVYMPNPSQFKSMEAYYSTLFHELIHSTGHTKRLKRKGIVGVANFGSENYSKEEMVAEIGRMFLCAECNIDGNKDNSMAYIQNWSKALSKDLKQDKNLLRKLCSQAQKGVDCIKGDVK